MAESELVYHFESQFFLLVSLCAKPKDLLYKFDSFICLETAYCQLKTSLLSKINAWCITKKNPTYKILKHNARYQAWVFNFKMYLFLSYYFILSMSSFNHDLIAFPI